MKIFFVITSILLSQNTWAYQFKSVIVTGYSKPWIMIHSDQSTVQEINRIRIHLHGWTQDPKTGKPYNPNFDFDWKDQEIIPHDNDLKKMVESYAIQKELESDEHLAIIIPISRGHCDQYSDLLIDFDRLFSRVLNAFSLNAPIVHFSAHSGGGQFLAKLLVTANVSPYLSQVLKASFFDAIYAESTLINIQNWMNQTKSGVVRSLQLITIPNQTPSVLASKFFIRMSSQETTRSYSYDGIFLKSRFKKTQSGNQISFTQESTSPTKLSHWSLVQKLWSL